MLSDRDIRLALLKRQIAITGLDNLYVGPASVDLHLDNRAKIIHNTVDELNGVNEIDTNIDNSRMFEDYNDWNVLRVFPGEFYVLSTVEKITLDAEHAGFVHGRSSLARIGLNIHMAGFVDPGFSGNITLEVTNFTSKPIVLYKHMRIGQMTFIKTNTPCEVPYNKKADSKYMGQSGPTLSKIDHDK